MFLRQLVPLNEKVLPSDCKLQVLVEINQHGNREQDKAGTTQLVEHPTEKLGSSPLCSKEFSPRVNF